jgi:hypothetical protein
MFSKCQFQLTKKEKKENFKTRLIFFFTTKDLLEPGINRFSALTNLYFIKESIFK